MTMHIYSGRSDKICGSHISLLLLEKASHFLAHCIHKAHLARSDIVNLCMRQMLHIIWREKQNIAPRPVIEIILSMGWLSCENYRFCKKVYYLNVISHVLVICSLKPSVVMPFMVRVWEKSISCMSCHHLYESVMNTLRSRFQCDDSKRIRYSLVLWSVCCSLVI